MGVKRYYLRKKLIDNKRLIDGNVASSDVALDLKQYVQEVIDEHITIDEGILSSAGTLSLTGATGVTVTATTGDLNLVSSAADMNIVANDDMQIAALDMEVYAGADGINMYTLPASGGDIDITADGDVTIASGNDVIITPTANLTFTLAAIPTHADDAAAGVAGLTAGQVYKTAAGALMIKL